jgi:DNA mismatch repair protein MutL
VNGRWIQDSRLTWAILQAYQGLLPKGRYPLGMLRIEMSPGGLDVNVHPAKTEVRFRDQGRVFAAIQRSVRDTLLEASGIPGLSLRPGDEQAASDVAGSDRSATASLRLGPSGQSRRGGWGGHRQRPA